MNVVTKVKEEYFQGISEIFNFMYSLCDHWVQVSIMIRLDW